MKYTLTGKSKIIKIPFEPCQHELYWTYNRGKDWSIEITPVGNARIGLCPPFGGDGVSFTRASNTKPSCGLRKTDRQKNGMGKITKSYKHEDSKRSET